MRFSRIIVGVALVVVGLPFAVGLVAIVTISFFDRAKGSLVSSGETREYLLYVPESYDAAQPTPLVVSLHAGATWPAHQQNLSRWNRLADEEGFLVVYPSGTPVLFDVVRIWHTFELDAGVERDVRFLSELIDTLQSAYNVDAERIYVNGMSNGGGMAYVLSCTLGHRLAAVGMVAPAQSLPEDWCPDARPVPMVAFHGTADPMVPYAGGRFGDPLNPVKPLFPAVEDFVARWAARNRCVADPVRWNVAPDVERLEYEDCADDATVELYTVAGAGHVWPGGKRLPEWRVGPNSDSVDATEEMWAFFRRHRLRRGVERGRPR